MKTKYLAYSDSRDIDAEGFDVIGKNFYTSKGISNSGASAFSLGNREAAEVSVAFSGTNKEYFGVFHIIRKGTLQSFEVVKLSEMIFGGTSLTISNSGDGIIFTSNGGEEVLWKMRKL